MNTKHFLSTYMKETATVSICNTFGEILYTGTVADIPPRLLLNTEFVSVDGLGLENDLFVVITD